MKTRRNKKTKQPVALVTGAAKGIGAAIAQRLAQEGYVVVVHYFKSKSAAEETLKKLQRISPQSDLVQGDVRLPETASAIMHCIKNRFGRLDVLVNTVGNIVYTPLSRTSTDEWEDVIGSNLSSVFYLTQAALPLMRANRFGRIINFSSLGAETVRARARTTPYAIAKAGIVALTMSYAQEVQRYGITVNAVSLGVAETSRIIPRAARNHIVPIGEITDTVVSLLAEGPVVPNGAIIEIAGGLEWKQE